MVSCTPCYLRGAIQSIKKLKNSKLYSSSSIVGYACLPHPYPVPPLRSRFRPADSCPCGVGLRSWTTSATIWPVSAPTRCHSPNGCGKQAASRKTVFQKWDIMRKSLRIVVIEIVFVSFDSRARTGPQTSHHRYCSFHYGLLVLVIP